MNLGEYIVSTLINQGIKHIFGIPGNQLTPMLESLYFHRDKISFIDCRNEAGASLMAEGYAKVSGKVSVCMVSPGPGAANTYIGVLEAYTSCSPLLLITVRGNAEYDNKGEDRLFHGLNHLEAFKAITKDQIRLRETSEAYSVMRKIFRQLTTGRPGPVLLEIQGGILDIDIDEYIPTKFRFPRINDSEERINKVAEYISRTKKPVIIAGKEVFASKAEKELVSFAKKINAPVMTTTMGKGVISDYEELSLGSILNYNYLKKTEQVFKDSDLCIAIGVRFTQVDTDSWKMKIQIPMITISLDDKYLNKDYKSEMSLEGDIKGNLNYLAKMVKEKPIDTKRIRRFKELLGPDGCNEMIGYFQDVMPKDGILVNDVHIEGFAYARYKVNSCNEYVHSGLSLGIGYALPAAIGVKFAFPDRKVVAFCGDGGFLMNSCELATVMKYKTPIVIVIVNDGGFGTIKRSQKTELHETIGLNLYNPDFMKLAESYNMKALRVERHEEIKATLETALKIQEPVIVEILKK